MWKIKNCKMYGFPGSFRIYYFVSLKTIYKDFLVTFLYFKMTVAYIIPTNQNIKSLLNTCRCS